MDRLTRKELKTDKFAQEVTHGLDYLSEHRKQAVRWGAVALGAAVIGLGIYLFMGYRANQRQKALADALHVMDATIGANVIPGQQNFKTKEEKEAAIDKALRDVAMKYDGTQEGAIARYNLAIIAADKGDFAQAEKSLQDIYQNAPKPYASLAAMSLAQLYAGQGKFAEAEKMARGVMANPTILVSKEMATIEVARILAASGKQDEARKLLEPMRTGRTAPSRAAIAALGELAQK